MALITNLPSSRNDFKEYCLRKLGKPVIKINLDDQNIEDCVNDALQMFFNFHFDGVEERWIICPITDTHVTQGYIDIPPDIIGVVEILPLSAKAGSVNGGLFDVNYQWQQNEFLYGGPYGIYQGWDLVYLEQSRMHMELMDRMFNPETTFHFNAKTNRIYLQGNLEDIRCNAPGGAVVFHVYVTLDYEGSNAYTTIWADPWLRKYCTALIKKQWGSVMKKFSNVQMLGGVTMDGKTIYDEAVQEVADLEEELQTMWTAPPQFFIG